MRETRFSEFALGAVSLTDPYFSLSVTEDALGEYLITIWHLLGPSSTSICAFTYYLFWPDAP